MAGTGLPTLQGIAHNAFLVVRHVSVDTVFTTGRCMLPQKRSGNMLLKKVVAALVALMLIACATTPACPPDSQVSIERELFEESDDVDFVYENGRFSYVSYLKKENIREEKKTSCPDQTEGGSPSLSVSGCGITKRL